MVSVMKQINIAPMNKSQKEEALNEAKLLHSLKSPYIVGYHDSYIENEKLCIIMEYCENGDLGQLLKARHGRLLEEDTIWKYFIEICLALLYLHNKKILHRDIKTMNVFLTKDFHVRLGDLGVAKVLNQNTNFAHTMVGTPYYLSPELCQEKPYNEKSDVWSLGCVLYEMCALKHPFESRNQAALIMKIIQGKYDALSNVYSKDLIELVTLCLQKDYRKRPTIHDVLASISIQVKAKTLRIDLPTKEALLTKTDQKKQANDPAKKVKQAAKPSSKPAKILVKDEKKEPKMIVKDEKKEPKKAEKKIEKKETPAPSMDQESKPKAEKKPVLQSPPAAGNINNNEFRKLLQFKEKEKPIADAVKEEKAKSERKAIKQMAVVTAPNFPQIKQEPTPVKEAPQKSLLAHASTPSPNLQLSRGKPKRVRNGAPSGLVTHSSKK